MDAAAALEALRPLLVAARQLVLDGLLEPEHYSQFARDLLKSLTLKSLTLAPPPFRLKGDGLPKPPLAGSGALPGNELDHLVAVEQDRLRLSGIRVPTGLDSSSDSILERMRLANLGMSMNSAHSSPQIADDSHSDASKRRRLDVRGGGSESSSNIVTFHPDCDNACCGSDCIHPTIVPVVLSAPGDCTSHTHQLVHQGSNESDDQVWLNAQFFVKTKFGKTQRGVKTFASGLINRHVAERAGRSLAAGFHTRFSGYSLSDRVYQGRRLGRSIEFPEELFDENIHSAAELERLLGSELIELKRAAEHEFWTKHGVEVAVFKIWASWKLPDCIELSSDFDSNGAFDKHLDYPAHALMFGTVVVATMFCSVAEYQAEYQAGV
jgi:hypothetical protein